MPVRGPLIAPGKDQPADEYHVPVEPRLARQPLGESRTAETEQPRLARPDRSCAASSPRILRSRSRCDMLITSPHFDSPMAMTGSRSSSSSPKTTTSS